MTIEHGLSSINDGLREECRKLGCEPDSFLYMRFVKSKFFKGYVNSKKEEFDIDDFLDTYCIEFYRNKVCIFLGILLDVDIIDEFEQDKKINIGQFHEVRLKEKNRHRRSRRKNFGG